MGPENSGTSNYSRFFFDHNDLCQIDPHFLEGVVDQIIWDSEGFLQKLRINPDSDNPNKQISRYLLKTTPKAISAAEFGMGDQVAISHTLEGKDLTVHGLCNQVTDQTYDATYFWESIQMINGRG
ncbi:MAG: hypothetical protein ABIH34_05350 [Nanoarchaeota archaeon]